MKKSIFLLMIVFLLSMSSIASAAHNGHNRPNKHKVWSHPAYQGARWDRMDRARPSLPFKWHERRNERFHDRIRDREWEQRFPGLRSYRWHSQPGHDFWYRGHRITNAVLFYDSRDELVSVGFMYNGTFIFIRDDGGYRNRDSFFISWSHW